MAEVGLQNNELTFDNQEVKEDFQITNSGFPAKKFDFEILN